MADSKISALTSGNPAQSGDEIPIARGGANYKITAGSIASLGGDVDGPASSVDNQIALFDSTTGKLIKAATTTGVLKASSGVIAAATSGTDYVAPAGAFSGLSWQSVQTTGFTAVAFRAYPCNTTSAAFTVTLPASPSAGDQITLTDYAGTFTTNNLTINPNGGKINGSTSNYAVSQNRGSFQLVYVDSTQGWLVYGTAFFNTPPTVDYLVVAGGGGGGAGGQFAGAGGGGAGGFRTGTGFLVTAGTNYTITVGGSGSGGTSGGSGSSGGNSVFGSITSNGGGGGASYGISTSTGSNGGSGGGGGSVGPSGTSTGGTGNTPSTSPSQGNNGGIGTQAGAYNGGGGGGAGAVGGNAGANGGNGGTGTASSITGSSVTYSGGGGGAVDLSGSGGTGGSGGGGAGGSNASRQGVAGGTNTGGGGGGSSGSSSTAGAAGGSGIVIISYPSNYAAAVTTGSPTVTVSGGNRIYTFTGNGSITW
jgi:hypothetical protein